MLSERNFVQGFMESQYGSITCEINKKNIYKMVAVLERCDSRDKKNVTRGTG